MRIYTKIVFDMQDGSLLDAESFDYEGPVCLCKGDETAKASEEIQQQNAQMQLQQSQQLMSLFQTQFGKQNALTTYLQGKMQPIIDAGGTGYSPEALAAMRTSATDNISNEYEHAKAAQQRTAFAQGGRDLPSGVDAQISGAMAASEAADKAGTQNQITQANENLKQQNYWNAMNELNGIAASDNPLGYAGAATSASGASASAADATAKLSEAYTGSQQSGLTSMLGGLAGGVFGAAGQAGGFSKLFR